jgi:hypothetical protein
MVERSCYLECEPPRTSAIARDRAADEVVGPVSLFVHDVVGGNPACSRLPMIWVISSSAGRRHPDALAPQGAASRQKLSRGWTDVCWAYIRRRHPHGDCNLIRAMLGASSPQVPFAIAYFSIVRHTAKMAFGVH